MIKRQKDEQERPTQIDREAIKDVNKERERETGREAIKDVQLSRERQTERLKDER
jgi:hypothetical protein